MNEQTHTTFAGEVKTPVIAGVEITTDKHGRFNLNALHKASGEGDGKKPGNWLRLDATKALIAELKNRCSDLSIAPVSSSRGGGDQGTFAHELLAVDYAGWISPAFRLEVHRVFIDYRTGTLPPAPFPADTLEQIERSFGIMRSLIHKVTEIEKALPGIVTSLVEPLVAARLAEQHLLLRSGKTAKQIWDAHGFPPRIKGSALWFGNRLAKLGCLAGGGMRADRGDKSIRLFDPDKATISLDLGFARTVEAYVAGRRGQRSLFEVKK